MDATVKPGYRTSELYITIFGMVLTYLASQGIIQASQINPLLNGFIQVYGSAIFLLGVFGMVRSYLQSRTAIKTKLLETQQSSSLTTS